MSDELPIRYIKTVDVEQLLEAMWSKSTRISFSDEAQQLLASGFRNGEHHASIAGKLRMVEMDVVVTVEEAASGTLPAATPVEPSALTVDDVRRWAERMAAAHAESADEAWGYAENAALREALTRARYYLDDRILAAQGIEDELYEQIDAALSGDAGAAFLAELQAARRVVEAGEHLVIVTRRYEQHLKTGANPNPVTNAAREYVRRIDTLSAPAANGDDQ